MKNLDDVRKEDLAKLKDLLESLTGSSQLGLLESALIDYKNDKYFHNFLTNLLESLDSDTFDSIMYQFSH